MINQNRVSKYLLYAIGEIFLVVIGILIALQLNTWKENNKSKQVETTYLKGILNNLDQDINVLNELLHQDSIQIKAFTTLLKAFTDNTIDIYSIPFIGAIGNAQNTPSYKGNSIIFEDMKSSGKINFIKSDALRFEILEYYKLSDENESETDVNWIMKLKMKHLMTI